MLLEMGHMLHINKAGRYILSVLLFISALSASLSCTPDSPKTSILSTPTVDKPLVDLPPGKPVPDKLGDNEMFCTNIDDLVHAVSNPIINTIYLAKGEYRLSTALDVDRSLSLYGPAGGGVIIYAANESRHITITGSSVDLVFGGVSLDGETSKYGDIIPPTVRTAGGIEISFSGEGRYSIVGAVINGCYSITGGGVHISKKHSAVLRHCFVLGNTATFGGGVYNDGTLTIIDCLIFGNEATIGGGGIWNYEHAILTMTSGEISSNIGSPDNVHQDAWGYPGFYGGAGGVYNFGVFGLLGGTISNNTTTFSGGGVYNDGTFYMTGGEISRNNAELGGGGVDNAHGIFTMDNGVIFGNKATGAQYGGNGNGGGISSRAALIMNGGEISGNMAAGAGGGVYVDNFTMNGGVIANNEAFDGGGVCVRSMHSSFVLNAGVICNNKAIGLFAWEGNGGGVYNDGNFTMTGGEIISNESHLSGIDDAYLSGGGGVYSTGIFYLAGGVISFNKAINGHGGGINNRGQTFTFTDGIIASNEAAIGGGVYNNTSNCEHRLFIIVSFTP